MKSLEVKNRMVTTRGLGERRTGARTALETHKDKKVERGIGNVEGMHLGIPELKEGMSKDRPLQRYRMTWTAAASLCTVRCT